MSRSNITKNKAILWPVFGFAALLPLVAIGQGASPRYFTDLSGKFRIRAIITNANETHVKLQKTDGKEVTIEIAKLSEKDQKYVNDAYQKYKAMVGDYPIGTKVEIFSTGSWHPGVILNVQPGKYFITFDKWSDSWNKWVTEKELRLRSSNDEQSEAMSSSTPATSEQPSLNSGFRKTASGNSPAPLPDLAKTLAAAKAVDLRTAPVANFDFTADPIPNHGKSLPLPPTITVEAERIGNPMQVMFDSTMQFVAIDPVNFKSGIHTTTIVPLDLSLPRWTISTGGEFAGVTEGAKSAMVLNQYSPYAYLRVSLEQDRTNIETSASDAWLPSSDHISQQFNLPGNRLLVVAISGIQLWDLESRTVDATFLGGSNCDVSGHGKYVACTVGQDTAVVFNTETYEVTHRFRTDGWRPLKLSFDPSGSRLAMTGVGRGNVYDLSTGEIVHSYGLTNGNSGELGVAWIGSQYLVLIGGCIVDLESGLPLWALPFSRQPLLQFDETTIGVTTGEGTEATIQWLRITPEQIAAAATVDTSGAIKIPRGAVATLDVSGLKHHAQQVKQYYESNLQSLGYTLGPNGMLQIRFSSTIGKPTKIRLKDFLKVSRDADATFVPATVHRHVLLNGMPIYDRTDEFGEKQLKSTIRIQADESAQQAVTRLTTPSESLFTTIALPRAGATYLPRTKGLIGEGTLKELAQKIGK
ncbi:MAG: SHD1 domain-containing protein [Rhodopirellula sp. JB055]|uniref:SHD1 domain-containing protein n=1 Tax=Rhodopirellula sp. JB055 TaxID=3342846 RepID=UPI00370A5C46